APDPHLLRPLPRLGRRAPGGDDVVLEKRELLRLAKELRLVRADRIDHAHELRAVGIDVLEVRVERCELQRAEARRKPPDQQRALLVGEGDAGLRVHELLKAAELARRDGVRQQHDQKAWKSASEVRPLPPLFAARGAAAIVIGGAIREAVAIVLRRSAAMRLSALMRKKPTSSCSASACAAISSAVAANSSAAEALRCVT